MSARQGKKAFVQRPPVLHLQKDGDWCWKTWSAKKEKRTAKNLKKFKEAKNLVNELGLSKKEALERVVF